MNCILEFRKMTFTNHPIFSLFAGIIITPLHVSWVSFLEKMFSHIHYNYVFIPLFIGLPHSTHVTAQDVSCFHLSINVSCILCINIMFYKISSKFFFLAFYAYNMMFVKFLWVCAKKFCVKLQLNIISWSIYF